MKVCGFNDNNRLGGSLNGKSTTVKYPCQSFLDVNSLLSFSTFGHTVWIMRNGDAYAIGSNDKGQISSTLPKKVFTEDTKINIKYPNGQPCKFISVVCSGCCTLYQIVGQTSNDQTRLVYSYLKKDTIFLNIGKRSPQSLFGGYDKTAIIDTEGEVIIIQYTTDMQRSLPLPNGEKAVKIACGYNNFVILSENGKVFNCSVNHEDYLFEEINELSGIKIIDVTGIYKHFFAISEDGRVFCCGNNFYSQLGITSFCEKFTLVESLSDYHVVEAFAGYWHSIFRTKENKFLGCGWNYKGELMIDGKEQIYQPNMLPIPSDTTFCVAGANTTIIFVGVDIPQNMPNRKITQFHTKIKELEEKDKEINSLKEELNQAKKRNEQLEEELKKLKEKISSIEKETKSANKLDIIDPETLDQMKKVKSLGRGATSEVFEITREEKLALKVYYPELIKDDNDEEEDKISINIENMKRFLLEYECLNQLNHPNIIKTFGISFGDSKHPPAILLEYCVSNLKKKIKKFTDEERIRAIVDISSAMKEVHSIGIIHRDLKLENILVDEKNIIKVSDFGLCTLIALDTETMSRTQMTGTLKYMAPELVQERTDYNEKVDVYAFGVVLFVILTKGEFPKISLHDVGNGKKAKIPSIISKFSNDLINRCWSYDASERPSFAEICQILKGNENKLI